MRITFTMAPFTINGKFFEAVNYTRYLITLTSPVRIVHCKHEVKTAHAF